MPAPSKRDKQSVKRGAHNKGVRTRLRNLSKSFYRAVESGDEGEARRIRDESQREYEQSRGQRHNPSEQGCPQGQPPRQGTRGQPGRVSSIPTWTRSFPGGDRRTNTSGCSP